MTLEDRLARMVDGLSDGQSVLIPVVEIRAWLQTSHDRDEMMGGAFTVDLTVEEVATHMGRRASTIRGWLNSGRIPGAYRLNGREWRVPVSALQSFQEQQRARPALDQTKRARNTHQTRVSLGDWRNEVGVRAA
jgi:excisionase family DNA binding protein